MRLRKKAGRSAPLRGPGGGAASMLFAAGCQSGSLGSSEEGAGGQAGAVTITFLGRRSTDTGSREALRPSSRPSRQPIPPSPFKARHAAGRFRRRQSGEDPVGDR